MFPAIIYASDGFASRRRDLGLTLDELAVASGISKSSLSRFERRDTGVPIEARRTLSEYLVEPEENLFSFPAPADAASPIAERRSFFGLTQVGVSRLAGLSDPYVAQLERGNIRRPSRKARRAIASRLQVDAHMLFAAFPPPEEEWIEVRRRALVRLEAEGRSCADVRRITRMSPTNLAAHRAAAGIPARPSSRTAIPPGKWSLTEAAKRRHTKPATLRRAITQEGRIRGYNVPGTRMWFVDPDEFAEDFERLPRCRYEGCRESALIGEACSTGHRIALRRRGQWWDSPEGQDFRRRMELDLDGVRRGQCHVCCRELRPLPPGQVAVALRSAGRRFCGSCWPAWRAARTDLQRVLRQIPFEGDTGRPARDAHESPDAFRVFECAVEVANDRAATILASWPKQRGRRRPVAVNLLVEACNAHGLRDSQIRDLLQAAKFRGIAQISTLSKDWLNTDELGERYVKDRRSEADIKRHRRPPPSSMKATSSA